MLDFFGAGAVFHPYSGQLPAFPRGDKSLTWFRDVDLFGMLELISTGGPPQIHYSSAHVARPCFWRPAPSLWELHAVVPRGLRSDLEYVSLLDGTVGGISIPAFGVRHLWIGSVVGFSLEPTGINKDSVLMEVDGSVPKQPCFRVTFVPRFSPDGEWMLASSLSATNLLNPKMGGRPATRDDFLG